MIQLPADQIIPGLLSALTEEVAIVDGTGQVLGRFTPDPERIKQLYGRADDLPDAAEIARQMASAGPGFTTRQVFEHLLTLTTDPHERSYLEDKIAQIAQREGCRSQ